jgi:hypothetical protein
MADINTIVNEDSYKPNPELGGVGLGVGKIDTKPLENLAAYSFAYNRQRYLDKQKQIEEQAKELANLTAYDLSSAIPKDREELTKKWNDLYGWVKENIQNGNNVLDFQNNQSGWLEYNKRKNDLENDISGGKVRSTIYALRQKEVTNVTDPDLKAYYQKTLDEEANSTNIRTPLKYTNQFDLNPVQVKAVEPRKIQVTDVGANMIGTRDYSLADMDAVTNQAVALTTGLMQSNLDENSPQFKAMSPEVQDQYRQQFNAQQAAGKLEPIESANNFNSALNSLKNDKKYVNEDGTFNTDALINSNNPIVAGIAEQVRVYNSKMDEMTNLIDNGAFTDNFGGQLKFGGTNGLNRSSYSHINLNDGISAQELLKMRILAASPANTATTKVQVTKIGLEQQRLNLDTWFKHQDIGVKQGELNLKKARFNEQMKQAKTVEQQDKALDNYFYDNIRQQPSIVFPTAKKNAKSSEFVMHINHDNSLPFLTINTVTGKASALIPIDGKPIYDKTDSDGNPATGAKVVGYSGGYYKPEFLINGQPVTNQQMVDYYNKYKANDKEWKGSFDQFAKTVAGQTIAGQTVDVRIRGANGTTDSKMNASALRIISNSNQKKGQASIFDNTDYQPSDGSTQTDQSSQSSSGLYYEDQNR